MMGLSKRSFALSALSFLASTSIYAQSVPGVHTWHMVYANDTSNWNGTLQVIHEKASFVKPDGSVFNTFTLNTNTPLKYGFAFDPQDDFDVAYTLTLTEEAKNFVSKTCVFVVTAKGPAKPDISVLQYNGATCSYKIVHGVGEDFYVG
ncbi:MAG: hypothetical protein WAW86_10020 [Gammaproteobacteria bacterium]